MWVGVEVDSCLWVSSLSSIDGLREKIISEEGNDSLTPSSIMVLKAGFFSCVINSHLEKSNNFFLDVRGAS